MKKFLSLVLALVMTMSLVTVSAGAKDFTDDSKITYDEAVAVMSTLGVVGGYADGAFNPANTLTRGAAAKIICNVILGTTAAGALVADAAPYKDVPVSNTFAGYIAYCAKEGIISGYADGTFRPAGTLTGYAFMKMLLGALGLDSEVEGYTGANWSISVAKRALSDGVDLADGLKGDFNGVKAVTREEACLYAFNMLKAGKFSYDNSSTITVGNIVIKNNSKAVQAPVNEEKNFAGAYFRDVFSKLTGVASEDNFNRPATEWKYDGQKIGTYAKTPDATYTAEVTAEDLYKDLALSKDLKKADVYEYINGNTVRHAKDIVKNDDDTKFGGNGTLTEAYLKKDPNGNVESAVIVEIQTFAGEITRVTTNSDKERIVKIGSKEYVTSEFAEDDIVLYTEDANASKNADKIQSMAATEKLTGELTKIKGTSEYTISGTTYKASATLGNPSVSVGDDVDFYLDSYGYLVKIDQTEDNYNADSAAYVLDAGRDRGGDWAKLLFADGTTKTVDLYKDYYTNDVTAYDKDDKLAAGDVVSFSVQKDGTYKLTYKGAGAENKSLDKDYPTANGTSTDSKTVYVYYLDGGDKVNVYTGYKSSKNITDATIGVFAKSGKNASVVFVLGAANKVTGSSTDLTVIAFKAKNKLEQEKDVDNYYSYKAVDNGEIVTIKVAESSWDTLNTAAGTTLFAAYNSMSYDKDNIASLDNTNAVKWNKDAGKAAIEFKNDMLTIAGTSYAYTDDVVVVEVEDDGSDLAVIDVKDIEKDDNGDHDPYASVYFKQDGAKVDYIVLVKNA